MTVSVCYKHVKKCIKISALFIIMSIITSYVASFSGLFCLDFAFVLWNIRTSKGEGKQKRKNVEKQLFLYALNQRQMKGKTESLTEYKHNVEGASCKSL